MQATLRSSAYDNGNAQLFEAALAEGPMFGNCAKSCVCPCPCFYFCAGTPNDLEAAKAIVGSTMSFPRDQPPPQMPQITLKEWQSVWDEVTTVVAKDAREMKRSGSEG